ncbi:hypothetical protein R3W88_026455 [Solanum pinnatisectum]|uniref:SFR19-like C-terminal domain-containing protein n=1 Tax=Solanum pinnatisectum TaxID=50273 RepID=A0AAV9LDI3_9SOLN|nr:hypothetical protein R3W88_026455 [Solanum pinnatisectum]
MLRSSCWFLHVRDYVISRNKDGVLDTAKMKNKVINGEGSKYTTERPASYCFSDFASSEVQCGGYQRLNSENDLYMHKDEDWSSMPFRDIGRETFGYKSYLAGYGSSSPPLLKDNSLNKDGYCSGMHPSSSVLSSYKYLNTDYHHLPFLNRSVDMRPSSYSTSSTSNLDPVGDQKLLDRCRDCLTRSMSLHNKSSALPGCGTESFSWTDLSGDTEHSCTSAPFRPSTFLSQIIPPPESLYDPIDLSANERKTADRAIAHQENMNTSSKEEKKQSKLEKLGLSCEIDTDFRRDGSVNFRIKELLKPTWHEGLLMRGAYKMIVKKAVDKIINEVPDTTESINQYLSVSKTKVAKLIEGYLEKYGKS